MPKIWAAQISSLVRAFLSINFTVYQSQFQTLLGAIVKFSINCKSYTVSWVSVQIVLVPCYMKNFYKGFHNHEMLPIF